MPDVASVWAAGEFDGSVPRTDDACHFGISRRQASSRCIDMSADALLSGLVEGCKVGGIRLPLPPIPMPPKLRSKNRGTWGRFRRCLRLWREAEVLRNCVNEVWSGLAKTRRAEDDGVPLPKRVRNRDCDVSRPWLKLLSVAQHLTAARRESFKESPTGAAVWGRLRKGVADLYYRLSDQVKYVDFVGRLIQELPSWARKVILLDVLPGQVAAVYSDIRNVLKTLSEEGREEFLEVRKRYDHVGGKESEFHTYLNRPEVDDYWEYFTQEELDRAVAWASAATLAVPRRKDHFLRKILACVPAGLLLLKIEEMFPNDKRLTEMGMYGGSSFALLEADDGRVKNAGSDETQAFTSIEMPAGHAELQAGPLVPVSCVPAHRRKESWGPLKKVRACYKRMAMGRADSVFLLMCIHVKICQEVIERHPRLSGFTILNALGVRLAGARIKVSRGFIYVHVDDVVAGHSFQELADYAIQCIVDELEKSGFVVKAELGGSLRKFVGYVAVKNGTLLCKCPAWGT